MVNLHKIGTRLYLAFGVLILLELIVVCIGIRQFHKVQALSTDVALGRWPKTVIANKIIDNVNGNGKAALALMFLTDPNDLKNGVAQMAEASKELTGFYEQLDLTVTDPAERKVLASIKEARGAYVGNRKTAIAFALNGRMEQARDMLTKETIPLQKAYLGTIYDLIERQGSAMGRAVTETDRIVSTSIALIAGLGLVSLLVSIGLVALLTKGITRPLAHAVAIAQCVADGKLDNEITVTGRGETGELLAALKHMQDKLNAILREIEDCGNNMEQAAYQVATISGEIADVSRQQDSRSGEVSAAMVELHQISSEVQAQAVAAAVRSRHVETLAQEGVQQVRKNIGSMEQTTQQVGRASAEILELEQSVQKIRNIVNAIREIAEQTNLLALNAAIEAAHARELGRGFAVVADEVRKLADRTTISAAEVNGIIGLLSENVHLMVGTMNLAVQTVNGTQEEAEKSAGTIESMGIDAVETAQGNQAISDASQKQLNQFGLLQATTETLFSVLKDNGAKVETTAAIGVELRTVTGRLNKIMASFTFTRGMTIEAAQHEQRRAPRAQNTLRVKLTQGAMSLDAVGCDFSLTGLGLRLPRPVDPQELLELSIYLPGDNLEAYACQQPLRIQGRMAWQRQEGGNHLGGVQFVSVDEHQRSTLKNCFAFFNKNSEHLDA